MMGIKEIINNISYQGNDLNKRLGGNGKAARLADSPLAHKQSVKGERWNDTLQTYSDYFIRY
ncbi:MAG: hypothetical protein COA63_005825 [Methylophaga sp.]|nr:hypothetical protein [Methylophaga sp.]